VPMGWMNEYCPHLQGWRSWVQVNAEVTVVCVSKLKGIWPIRIALRREGKHASYQQGLWNEELLFFSLL
jgi:hypothetical protein